MAHMYISSIVMFLLKAHDKAYNVVNFFFAFASAE